MDTFASRLSLALALSFALAPAAAAEEGGAADAVPSPDAASAILRGAYVFNTASCGACHYPNGVSDGPASGGRPIRTDFGTFYGTNLTPDVETGIGRFTEADLRRALREGRGPDGERLWPVFPYGSYTGMSDGDIADLYAFLMAQPAVSAEARPPELSGAARIPLALRVWRLLYLDEGPYQPDPMKGDVWNRGAYLIEHEGHCGECHTPRTRLGGLKGDEHLAGAPYHGSTAPNLTPDPQTGLGGWTAADWQTFFTAALTPEGDIVGGEMGAIVDRATSRLTPTDRDAIIAYLMSLPPTAGLGEPPAPPEEDGGDDGEDLW